MTLYKQARLLHLQQRGVGLCAALHHSGRSVFVQQARPFDCGTDRQWVFHPGWDVVIFKGRMKPDLFGVPSYLRLIRVALWGFDVNKSLARVIRMFTLHRFPFGSCTHALYCIFCTWHRTTKGQCKQKYHISREVCFCSSRTRTQVFMG